MSICSPMVYLARNSLQEVHEDRDVGESFRLSNPRVVKTGNIEELWHNCIQFERTRFASVTLC